MDEKTRFEKIFLFLDKQNEEYVQGHEIVNFFIQAGVTNKQKQSRIFELADVDNDRILNQKEFFIAIKLAYSASRGIALPDTLPQDMLESVGIKNKTRGSNDFMNYLSSYSGTKAENEERMKQKNKNAGKDKQKIAELKIEIEQLTGKLSAAENKNKLLSEKLDKAISDKNTLQEKFSRAVSRTNNMEREMKEAESRNRYLDENVTKLKAKLTRYEARNMRSGQPDNGLADQLDNEKQKNLNAQRTIKRLENEVEELERNIEHLRKQALGSLYFYF